MAWGLAAGTGFALLFIGLNRAGSGAGIWPVFSGLAAESVVLACLVALTRGFRNVLTGVRSPDTAVLALLTGLPAAPPPLRTSSPPNADSSPSRPS